MTRVLFVEASSGGVVGGSLTGLLHLARGLDRRRFTCAMALYERKGIEEELAAAGIEVMRIGRRRIPRQHRLAGTGAYQTVRRVNWVRGGMHLTRQTLRLLVEEIPPAVALARILRQGAFDVVHLGNGLRANFDGLLAAVGARRPVVCHVKGFEKYGSRERWLSRRVDVLVCMTEALLAHCRASGLRPRQARVVYDGVDPSWLRPQRSREEVRAELGLPPQAPCVVLSGNVQPWKGQHVLVEAASRLRHAIPELRCLIVGGIHRAGEEYARELKRLCTAHGLAEQVIFTGFRKDVVDVVNAADVVVHTSVRPEPFGRVILEGMLLGKPVIAAGAGGVPELIEDGRTGILVPPGDAEALAAALKRVLADPEVAAALGQAGRVSAEQKFSLRNQIQQMEEIYESLARRQSK